MATHGSKNRLLYLLNSGLVILLGFQTFHWLRWRERADSPTGVALELKPSIQVIEVGGYPRFSACLVNRGESEVTLVEPGDGSDCGWRTPLVEWSRERWFRMRLCGNINALSSSEVFILKPGESKKLSEWVGVPYLEGSGRYKVAVRYTNIPDHGFLGMPLEEHDPAALKMLRQSTKVSAVSNSVEIIVE